MQLLIRWMHNELVYISYKIIYCIMLGKGHWRQKKRVNIQNLRTSMIKKQKSGLCMWLVRGKENKSKTFDNAKSWECIPFWSRLKLGPRRSIRATKHQNASDSSPITNSIGDRRSLIPCKLALYKISWTYPSTITCSFLGLRKRRWHI